MHLTHCRLVCILFAVCCGPACAGSNHQWSHGAMATTANPHATDAAVAMLARGGHAVDAAIAAHAVLGLVEPQSSGIGGGGFMLVFERESGALVFHDGRETAPAGATVDMFMSDGQVMPFLRAWQSGLSVGVPGAIALYKQAHDKHGRLPWRDLFTPAIALAETGFEVSPRLANFLPRMKELSKLDENPGAAEYFFPGGQPLTAGVVRKNPEYAATLTRIAEAGPIAFYTGEIAEAIVAAVQATPDPGTITLSDLANYEAKERAAICGSFRDHTICSATPPSSGAAQIMIAQLYDRLLSESEDKTSAFVDAQRLAYADRDHYFGDPDHAEVPLVALLSPEYIEARAAQRFLPSAQPLPGNPGVVQPGPDTTEEASGTTHLSVIDGDGNAVSFTATVEAPFGSSRWVQGFLLNNELTDFAREVAPSGPHPANAIEASKRPRSSMSPTMVFDQQGSLELVTGSPGGNSIPAYVAKSILGILDWGLSPQEAADYPNIIARGQQVRVETGVGDGAQYAERLKAAGYAVQERDGENSGIHIIQVTPNGLVGAADMRREGTVGKVVDKVAGKGTVAEPSKQENPIE